jgi:hypothetical protein
MTILKIVAGAEATRIPSEYILTGASIPQYIFIKLLAFFDGLWESNVCVGASPMKSIFQNSMRRSPEMMYLCCDRRAALVTWPLR